MKPTTTGQVDRLPERLKRVGSRHRRCGTPRSGKSDRPVRMFRIILSGLMMPDRLRCSSSPSGPSQPDRRLSHCRT